MVLHKENPLQGLQEKYVILYIELVLLKDLIHLLVYEAKQLYSISHSLRIGCTQSPGLLGPIV